MKIVKNSMRLWFTVTSIISFLMGWVLLSHAQKPVPLQINTPAVSAPVSQPSFQSFNSNSGSVSFPFSSQVQQQFFRPVLRTGGS